MSGEIIDGHLRGNRNRRLLIDQPMWSSRRRRWNNGKMNVVFIGTTAFGLRCLDALLHLPECRIVGAIAAPQTFPISYRPRGLFNVRHVEFTRLCTSAGVPSSLLTDSMNDPQLWDQVVDWKPDAFVVAGWFHMVPKRWREMAPAYGLHASLLPDYKGGAPLVWALINGENKTGITLFQLGNGVDDGPILGQAEAEIRPADTIATLYARIEDLGVALLQTHIPRLADGSAVLKPQDPNRGRLFPQRGPEDGSIDWKQPAKQLYDFIRAQTQPYPGAFTNVGSKKLTIWSSRVVPSDRALQAGQFACRRGRMIAGTGDEGALELLTYSLLGEDICTYELCRQIGSEGWFE